MAAWSSVDGMIGVVAPRGPTRTAWSGLLGSVVNPTWLFDDAASRRRGSQVRRVQRLATIRPRNGIAGSGSAVTAGS
jgi:hypothetical protein